MPRIILPCCLQHINSLRQQTHAHAAVFLTFLTLWWCVSVLLCCLLLCAAGPCWWVTSWGTRSRPDPSPGQGWWHQQFLPPQHPPKQQSPSTTSSQC